MMITYKEAVDQLEKWQIKHIEERLKLDRKTLLNDIILCMHEHVPFQNITLLASSNEQRQVALTNEQIKEMCFAGVGGLCYVVATFCHMLLNALGFSVRMLNCTATTTHRVKNSHAMVVVDGLDEANDIYLVDCGTGFPTFRAISLSFVEESPVFNDSFLEYKYIRHEENVLRMHGKGDMIKSNNPPIEGIDFIIGNWRRFYYFDLDQNHCDTFKPAENAREIVVAGQTVLTSSPRAVWFPGKRAVIIVNDKLMMENTNGELVTTTFSTDEEIAEAYLVHFPYLKQEMVKLALDEWHRVSPTWPMKLNTLRRTNIMS